MTTPPTGSREAARALKENLRVLTRTVTQDECRWLDHAFIEGQTVFLFHGPTYGCIGPYGVAVSMAYGEGPFFELPADALRAALAPPAYVAGEVEEIRARYEDDARDGVSPGSAFWQGHLDVGTLLRLLDAERARRVEWQPIETAPKDGQYILAIVGKNDSRPMAHLEGRVFSIRPEPFGAGWSVYPGYGGAPSEWFTCWKPLDLPATHKDTQDE